METIVIGKPAVNVYLPLQEFPQEGDIFNIRGKNESVGNVGATSACLLAKWGMSTHFTGVVGNDAFADRVRNTFKEYKVNSKFMETDFNSSTAANYIILNTKTGAVTKVLFNDPNSQLQKYKYDFIPNFSVIDGTDFSGAHALLNNNANCQTVFYGRIGDKDTVAMSKRCTYVICTETFVNMMTHEESDGTAEGYVNLYQKIVDVSGKSNYIVILNNHKILYSIDGKVKMLPEMKINVADYSSFDSIFVGAFSFCVMNNVTIDDAIKFANTAAAISISKIGEVSAIPEVDEVLDNSGLREKLGLGRQKAEPIQAQSVAPLNPEIHVSTQEQTGMTTEQNGELPNSAPTMQTPVVDAFSQQAIENSIQGNPTESANAGITQQESSAEPLPMAFNQTPMSQPQPGLQPETQNVQTN